MQEGFLASFLSFSLARLLRTVSVLPMACSRANRGWSSWRWTIPLLAIVFCAPTRLLASCGDHVKLPGYEAPKKSDLPKPCSGPGCSRGHGQLPSSTTTAGQPVRLRDTGYTVNPIRLSDPDSAILRELPLCLSATDLTLLIYHPPRAHVLCPV
jgi:hypothetical protein